MSYVLGAHTDGMNLCLCKYIKHLWYRCVDNKHTYLMFLSTSCPPSTLLFPFNSATIEVSLSPFYRWGSWGTERGWKWPVSSPSTGRQWRQGLAVAGSRICHFWLLPLGFFSLDEGGQDTSLSIPLRSPLQRASVLPCLFAGARNASWSLGGGFQEKQKSRQGFLKFLSPQIPPHRAEDCGLQITERRFSTKRVCWYPGPHSTVSWDRASTLVVATGHLWLFEFQVIKIK